MNLGQGRVVALEGQFAWVKTEDGQEMCVDATETVFQMDGNYQAECPLIDGLVAKDTALLKEIYQTCDLVGKVCELRQKENNLRECKLINECQQVELDSSEKYFLEKFTRINALQMLSASGEIINNFTSQSDNFNTISIQKITEPLGYGALCTLQQNEQKLVVLDKVQRHSLICPIELERQLGFDLSLCSWEPQSVLRQIEVDGFPVGICGALFNVIKLCQPAYVKRIGTVCCGSKTTTILQRALDVSVCLAGRLKLVNLAEKVAQLWELFYSFSGQQNTKDFEIVTMQSYRFGAFVVRNPQRWKYGNQDESGVHRYISNGVTYFPGRLFGRGSNPDVFAVQWLGGEINVYQIGDLVHLDSYEKVYYGIQNTSLKPESGRELLSNLRAVKCACGISAQFESPIGSNQIHSDTDLYLLAKTPIPVPSQESLQAPHCVLLGNQTTANSKRNTRTVRTKYPQRLLTFQELVQIQDVPKPVLKFLKLSPLAYFAGPAVAASGSRARMPAIVTVGVDWHHGTQWAGQLREEKLGVMIPNRAYQQGGQVCVRWLGAFRAEIQQLRFQAQVFWESLDRFSQGEEGLLEASFSMPVQTRDVGTCYVYDAGKNRIFELAYYDRRVTFCNFRPGALVGPGLDYSGEPQLLGVLMAQQGSWAIVYWMSGSVNRHRIGSQNRYELCYASGY